MHRTDMSQWILSITNIGVIVSMVYVVSELQQINHTHALPSSQDTVAMRAPAETSFAEAPAVPAVEYIDASALKCPSSYDEVAKTFKNENYWIFQKKKGEENVSLVLRPDRDTGTWNIDVETPARKIIVTPDFYEWESFIYTGINILNRKTLTLERKRSDRATATSQCEAIKPEQARTAVESRYKQLIEGNKI